MPAREEHFVHGSETLRVLRLLVPYCAQFMLYRSGGSFDNWVPSTATFNAYAPKVCRVHKRMFRGPKEEWVPREQPALLGISCPRPTSVKFSIRRCLCFCPIPYGLLQRQFIHVPFAGLYLRGSHQEPPLGTRLGLLWVEVRDDAVIAIDATPVDFPKCTRLTAALADTSGACLSDLHVSTNAHPDV